MAPSCTDDKRKEAGQEQDFCCMKYNSSVPGDAVRCCDPTTYCKFRPSCLISFMEKEQKKQLNID